MGWFPYAYDGHPRDKKREFLKEVFILTSMDVCNN